MGRKTTREGDTGIRTRRRKWGQEPCRNSGTTSAKALGWEWPGTLEEWSRGPKREKQETDQRSTRGRLGGADPLEPCSNGEDFDFHSG